MKERNSLKLLMDNTHDKRQYRKIQAVLQKADGKTYEYIAGEHRVHLRTAEQWISDYVKNGIEGLKIRKPGGLKSSITDKDREIILSVLFNEPNIFDYLRNTWSLRSLAKCLTDELDIKISFKHLQRILKDMGIRCKRPKLELEHGTDYEEGKEKVENYKQVSLALKKRE